MGLGQKQQHKPGGNELGDNGSIGHAGNTGVENQHKYQIQYNIEDTGQDQEVQGPCGVSHRTQQTAAHIIDQKAGASRIVNTQINRRLGEHILRGGHEFQHGVHSQNAAHREEQAQQEGSRHGRLHGLVKLLHVTGPKIPANDHTGTGGEAVKKEHQHIDDDGGRPHRRQGLGAYKVAHHHGVHRVVKHLENIAQHQRQAKKDHLPDNGAAGHVPGRCFFSLFSFHKSSRQSKRKQRTTDNREFLLHSLSSFA